MSQRERKRGIAKLHENNKFTAENHCSFPSISNLICVIFEGKKILLGLSFGPFLSFFVREGEGRDRNCMMRSRVRDGI